MRRILFLLLALLAPLASVALDTGGAIPALELPFLAGKGTVALASLRGQVIYVDFWASWCVPCRDSMPVLDALYRKNKERGFTVVGVNKDVSPADADRFLKRVPVTFSLVQDQGDAAAKAFGVRTMPSGFLVDRKGMLRKVHRGFSDDGSALEREVEELLKESQ